MKFKDAHFDMVRPGIMLYGGLPSPEFDPTVPLKQVMRFSGEVIQVQDFPDHTPVSYGRTYYTQGPRRIAVLSAGYGEGLPNQSNHQKGPGMGQVEHYQPGSDATQIQDGPAPSFSLK